MPSLTLWMDLKGITLSKISHTEKDNCNMISLTSMCNLKKSPKTKATELIDTENRWLWPGAEDGGGMGEMGENFKKKTIYKLVIVIL